jgi:hypothetical protein
LKIPSTGERQIHKDVASDERSYFAKHSGRSCHTSQVAGKNAGGESRLNFFSLFSEIPHQQRDLHF